MEGTVNQSKIIGRIHSFQSLGTVDGPGVRTVVFMQGCPLRCICCHNPDTWDAAGGSATTVQELTERILRYRNYFGAQGGVTVSGGEPLCQLPFVTALFRSLRSYGIHTALDTAGIRMDAAVESLLAQTDLVLLDVKYTNEEDYLRYTGMHMDSAMTFLRYLEQQGIPTWLRHVVIPGYNDQDASFEALSDIARRHSCVKHVELLPLRKLCLEKYREMGMTFPLADTPEPSAADIEAIRARFPHLR